MFYRKALLKISIVVFAAILFGVGYNWGLNSFYGANTKKNNTVDISDKFTSATNSDGAVSPNAKVILKLRVKNSNKEYEIKSFSVNEIKNELKSLTFKEVENHFKDEKYFLGVGSKNEVVLVKESIFEPGKYYLGATDVGFLAIFKCDTEGFLFIESAENDISGRKIEDIPYSDREFIKTFYHKFETKDDAQDELIALCS